MDIKVLTCLLFLSVLLVVPVEHVVHLMEALNVH